MRTSILLALLGMITLYSCQEAYFEADKELASNVWTYEDPFVFSFSAKDTSQKYNFLLEVEHTTEYPYQNLYIQVETIFPDGDTVRDPFSVNLADKFGHWNGDCWRGSCSLMVPIQQSVQFRQVGEHTLRFHQYSRQDSLSGIEALSFRIEQAQDSQ